MSMNIKLSRAGMAIAAVLTLLSIGLPVRVSAAASPASDLRFTYVDQSGAVYLKSGSMTAPYIKIWDSSDPATSVKVSHKGIAILDHSNNLYVNTLPIQANWTLVTTGVTANNFGLSDSGVVMLNNNTLYFKYLAHLGYAWDPFLSGAQTFKLSAGGNMAAVRTDGTLYEAFGGYGAQWRAVATNFSSYDVSNTSLAVVFGPVLSVMIGAPVNNSWLSTYYNAASVQISPNGALGVTDPSGNLAVALGGYGSAWTYNVRSAADSTSTYVSDGMVSAFNGGTLFAKLGGITGAWSQVAGSGDVVSYSIQ